MHYNNNNLHYKLGRPNTDLSLAPAYLFYILRYQFESVKKIPVCKIHVVHNMPNNTDCICFLLYKIYYHPRIELFTGFRYDSKVFTSDSHQNQPKIVSATFLPCILQTRILKIINLNSLSQQHCHVIRRVIYRPERKLQYYGL